MSNYQAADTDRSHVIAEHGPFILTGTGATATGDPTYEQWRAAMDWTQQVVKASPFWIGDLVNIGEHRYGEMYSQALDATAYCYGTLANMAYVCSRVDIYRRRELLSFSHHQVVAPLPPEQQTAWLEKALARSLTVQELRLQIKAATSPQNGPELWVDVECFGVDDQSAVAELLRSQGRAVRLNAGTAVDSHFGGKG